MKKFVTVMTVALGSVALFGGTSSALRWQPPKTGDVCKLPGGSPGSITTCTNKARMTTWACCPHMHGACVGENGYPHGAAHCLP